MCKGIAGISYPIYRQMPVSDADCALEAIEYACKGFAREGEKYG